MDRRMGGVVDGGGEEMMELCWMEKAFAPVEA